MSEDTNSFGFEGGLIALETEQVMKANVTDVTSVALAAIARIRGDHAEPNCTRPACSWPKYQ